jgi:nucleotide-binding universal stress UspA family protein
MLRWSLNRLPLHKKERLRLKREELDAKGFVAHLERLLLASDDSANGKFAAQLAGIIAGLGGKPTTIIDLTAKSNKDKSNKDKAEKTAPVAKSRPASGNGGRDGERFEEAVKSAAEATTSRDHHPVEEKRGKVEVITRQDVTGPEAVAGEAGKGYDLLIIGIANPRDPKGGFSEDLSLITQGFEGPLAVVDTRLPRHEPPKERHGRVLIPVNGTDVSRRAVEVGLTLARASDAHVTALYVTRASASPASSPPRRQVMRRDELGVLKDIAALAERYDVALRNATRADMAPDEAILQEAGRGYDLVVLGVSRRPGDMLFFGNTAAAVLERSPTSILFVAS